MANILILGGGFGGLITAEELAKKIGDEHQITLISPNRNFTFYPALVQLAFGACSVEDVQFDLVHKLREMNVRFIQAEMIRIDPAAQTVRIAGPDIRGDISYDHLVIATGRRLATEKVSGFFDHAHHLLGVKAAMKFGEAVDSFEEGTIIVGLCQDGRLPVPVCETAFALANRFREKIDNGAIRLKIVFPGSLSEAFGGAAIHKKLEAAFAKHKINLIYDVPINEIRKGVLKSSNGHEIEFNLLMLVPPFRGNAALSETGITDDFDFVLVDGRMKVHRADRMYSVGDIVAFSGPKLAHMAVEQAKVTALNIEAELIGREPEKEYYHEIATIIDAGGPESIYLHYGIWDDNQYRLKKGRFWGWAKEMHDRTWMSRHGQG